MNDEELRRIANALESIAKSMAQMASKNGQSWQHNIRLKYGADAPADLVEMLTALRDYKRKLIDTKREHA
jgi:hypothetical protein